MKLLLVSGGMHRIISGYATKKASIFNHKALELKDLYGFLQETDPGLDGILVTDEAFSGIDATDKQALVMALQWLAANHQGQVRIMVLTRDAIKEIELQDLCKRYDNFVLKVDYRMRIPQSTFFSAFSELASMAGSSRTHTEQLEKPVEQEKRKSFLDRFRSKSKSDTNIEATDQLAKDLENVSRGISRVVAVTGHRGSGLTSTAVNLACEANKRGLSTMLIDMDVDFRSMNLYFSSFHEMSKQDADVNASLIRTLARPQDYMTTAFNLKDKLWMTSLGYDFTDKRLVEQFFNSSKMVGLLSILRSRFNLVILDMPLELFKKFEDILIHIDVIGLCVPNNLHAILSTLRHVEAVLDKENASYLNAKSKVIVTKYNDRSRFLGDLFVPEKVGEILSSGISRSFTYEMKLAGHVPYGYGFDEQIDSDVPLVNTSKEYEKAYGNILLRLMEGAK